MAEHVRFAPAARSIGSILLKSFKTFFAVATVLLLWSTEAQATHAMGGELTYECVGPNRYRVRLNFYRDCNGVSAPSNCSNGRQFRVRSTQCNANFTACFGLDGVEVVTPICLSAIDRCVNTAGQYGIQRYRYSTIIDLNQWASCGTDWIIDWDLCCRNNAITSLNNPGGRNLYLYARLNNTLAACNNSPRYLNDPTPFACVGQQVSYNHGFNDVDGDSLSFSLTPALGTNGSTIPYNAGYSFTQPIVTSGGANAVQIDPVTGTISFVPSIQQFSVVSVLVREWRNGVQIGEYIRDVQFAIIACVNNNPSVSGINGSGQFSTTVCAGQPITFTVPSTDADPGQTVTMTWNNGIPGASFTVGAGPLPVGTFTWTPTAANIGQNLFTVNVQDDACALNGVNNFGFSIQVTPPFTPANAGPDQSVCGLSTTMAALLPFAQVPGQWSVISGSGTFANPGSPTSTVTGLTPGPNVFQWSVNYGTCGTTNAQVTVNAFDPAQPAANAGPNQDLCLPTTSTTLAGNTATFPAVGTWTVVSGSGVFANANSANTAVSGLAPGNNVFRWTIDNGACTPPTNSLVTIRVFDNNQPAANAGPDQQLCAPNTSTTLAGNQPIVPATGLWTVVSGTGTFANAAQRNTTVSGLSIGVNTLRWTITNGPCLPPNTADEVNIVVFDPNSPNANAGPNQQVCSATATLAGSTPTAPATGTWTVVSGTGTFANASSPGTGVSGLSIGNNVFQWTVNNGPCANGITTSQVTITRFDTNTPVANAGPDIDLCSINGTGQATATMAGTAATAPATGVWTLVSGVGGTITNAASPTTTITGIPVGTHVYQWTVNNGPCVPPTSNDQVTIRVFDRNAPVANAGPDQELCAPVANVTLAGNAATAPASGQWTVVSGNGVFANANSPTTTVSGMAIGNNVYRWTISNGPCPGAVTTDDVIIRLFDPATAAANAGPDQEICGTGTTNLAGNAVALPATGAWTLVSGSGVIANAASPTTSVSGVGIGTNVFRWTVNNGPCGTSSDEVTIFRFDPSNPAANAGPDQSICLPVAPNVVIMAGSAVIAPASGTWSQVSGPNTANIVSVNSPTTSIGGLIPGTYVFQWAVSNGPCPNGNTTDLVNVLVYDAGTPAADAGPDINLCSESGSTTMAGSSLIAPATGTWILVNGSGTITDPSAPNTTVTGLGVGQNIFQWTVNNGPCGITTDQMSIFVYDPNNPSASAGPDQQLCTTAGNTINLQGSPVTFPAFGVWSVSGGPANIQDPNSPNTIVTDLTSGTYSFTWTVNNGVCPNPISSSTQITVVADGNAQPALAGPDQSICGNSGTVTMSANAAVLPATGFWTVVQGQASFSNVADHNAVVSGLATGVNILQWNIDNLQCGITTDQLTILVYDPNNPVANAGADQQLCTSTGTASTNLAGSAVVVPAVGQWTLISGSGTLASPNSPNSGVSGLGLGANVFQWTVNNGVCANPITTDQVTIFLYEQDAPVANAGPDQEICTPQSTVNMAANSATNSAIGTWTSPSGVGVIASPNNPNTQISGLPVGEHTFIWSIDNGPCGITTDAVVIRVFDATNPVANAGPDQQICTPASSTTLAGSSLIFPATGQWTVVSGNGVFADASNPGTTVSGLTVGVHVFAWTVSNGPCANGITVDQVTIEVFEDSAPAANAGPDQELCTTNASTTLAGSPVVAPATGQWVVVSGTATIADPTSPNTAITNIGQGICVLEWVVNNGACGTTSDQVSILVFDENNADADAGPDQELCTPTSTTNLQGNTPTIPAVGTWTLVNGFGVIADANDPNSAVSGLQVGENIFRWTVYNGPCTNGTTFDEVSIFVFDENNPVANAGADQEFCTPNTITTLIGSSVTFPATGTWTLADGSGVITNPNSPVTTVTGLGVGENIFVWTVSNGPCANGVTDDAVSIFLFDANNPQPNAGPDQELCTATGTTSATMAGSAVTFPAQGTWSIINGSGTIVSPNDPNTLVTDLPVGEHVLLWTVENGPCETGAGISSMTIRVFDENNPVANAGADQELCTTSIATTNMQGSPVTFPASGEWTIVSGSGVIANPSDPNTVVFDLGIGETILEWTVSNGPCTNGITTDQVSIQVFDVNNLNANAGPDQDLCTPQTSTTLSGSAIVFPAQGTWTVVSGQGTVTDPNDPNSTITNLGVGVIVVEWTVDNGPCSNGITSDQMVITLYDESNPVANAGPDQQLCTPTGTTTSSTLQGSNIIFPAVGAWQVIGGTGVVANVNDPNSAVSGLSIGENIFQWTVSNGVCANSLTSDVMSIFVFDENNPDANAGPDQQVCTPVTNAFMNGSPITFPAVGTWTVSAGSGDIEDINDPLTNITNLGLGTNVFTWTVFNGACPNSLTSDAVTIVLFDADAPPAAAGPDQELCFPDDVVTLSGNPTVGAAIGTWTLVQGAGNIASPNSNVTQVSDLEIGINIFAWTIESGDCVTTTDQVSILVFDPNNLNANAGLDQQLCTPQDSVFMAGSPVIVPAVGTWTVVSGSGNIVDPNDPNTLITELGVGVNIFQWEVYNGPCANSLTSDLVSITLFSDTTAAANAGPNLESCVPINTVQLQAETPPPPAVGTWSVIAGAGVFSDVNDPNATVSELVQGVNTFVWTLEWDPCPNNGILTDTVNVLLYNPNAPLANAGPDQQLCTPDSQTNLQANTPETPGVGTWTVTLGNATVVDVNDPNTLVTDLTVGVHEFVWTIYNGQCGFGPPSTDTVRVSVYDGDAPDAAVGANIDLCTPVTEVQLEANDPVFPAVGTWVSLSGQGTITDPNDPNTTVTGLGVGVYDFQWTIDNGACGSSSATVAVSIYDGDANAANAGPDKALCTPETSTQMAGNAPVFPGTGLWTVSAGTGIFADATNPTTSVSGLSIGTNTFVWTISNGPCGDTQDAVTITVFDQNQPNANAGPDQELCTPTSSTQLQGSAVTFPAVGTWVIVSGNGNVSDPNNPNATLSGLGVGQVVLQWVVDNGPCDNGITTDEVTISIFDSNAQAAAAGPDQSFCTPITETVSMFASAATLPGAGSWSLVSGAGTIVSPSDPFSAITGLGLGQNVFAWTIDNGACGSTSDQVTIFVYDHTVPPANAGPSQQFCQDITTTNLQAVPATSTAFGTWSLFSGNGVIAEPNDPNTFVSGLTLGNNWFTWTVDNGACGSTSDTMLVFIKDCLTIRIPDAFSPNDDGVNDVVVIPNIESYPQNRITIFNRWGNKVYEAAPYTNQWDGTSQFGSVYGEKLPESTYYYVLDLGDGSDAYTGFIYLRR
ncbi:MAG: gliding motility-associated C-terminal domain-containing protein [Flavobacteriales bacterium]|nr:gliding motility-associated C-terminal domain-containing protein [Flavobacteriales bacterium]